MNTWKLKNKIAEKNSIKKLRNVVNEILRRVTKRQRQGNRKD